VIRIEGGTVRTNVAHANGGIADEARTVVQIGIIGAVLRRANEHHGIVVDRASVEI